MKKIFTFLAVLLISSSNFLFAGDAAPSSHLYYSGGNANSDIWMNMVNIPTTSTYTYYSVMGWNGGIEGGGYCGIQDHPDGKNFIFSIWDPSNSQPIVGAYAGPGTNIENFGGEGTGLKSWNFKLGWKTGTWYTLITRVWQKNGHTFFGFWSQDQSTQIWTHLVTMDYPVANVTFKGGNDAFIEDWIGSGVNTRKVLFKDCWQRSTAGSWKLLKAASFSSNSGDLYRNGIYDQAFNAGVESGAFFMQTGGSTTHSFSGRSTSLSITSSATAPTSTTGEITDFISAYNSVSKKVNVAWDVNSLKSPQHSYIYEVFNNANFTGNALIIVSDTIPQQRTLAANVASLANGTYYTRLRIRDIYDNISVSKTATINIGTSPNVVITSPTNNATVGIFKNTIIKATASSISTTISKVEFYADNTKLGEDLTEPYEFATTFQSKGTVKITAIAYDANQITGSADILVNLDFLCNKLSGTKFGSSPAYSSGSEYDKAFDGNTNTYFDFSGANAGNTGLDFGQGAVINGIKFFPREGNAGRMTGGKFQASNVANFSSGVVDLFTITSTPQNGWNEAQVTNYNSYRYVRYLSPNNGYCNVAEIEICGVLNSANQAPSISITSPLTNASFAPLSTITFNVSVLDADGIVNKVEYYNGNTLIGTSTTSPFTFDWTNVTQGTYTIKAKATDNVNATTTSSTITVYVSTLTGLESDSKFAIAVYPNPTTSEIQFSQKVSDVTIQNLNGETVQDLGNSELQNVDVNTLSGGVYILTFKVNNQIFKTKIVKI